MVASGDGDQEVGQVQDLGCRVGMALGRSHCCWWALAGLDLGDDFHLLLLDVCWSLGLQVGVEPWKLKESGRWHMGHGGGLCVPEIWQVLKTAGRAVNHTLESRNHPQGGRVSR